MWKAHNTRVKTNNIMLDYTPLHYPWATVEPQLSGPHLSGTLIIQTCSSEANYIPMCMRRGYSQRPLEVWQQF